MAGNKERHFKSVPRWRIALWLASLHAFRDDYFGSRWYDWDKRIKDGHDAEENRINKSYEKTLKKFSPDDPYFADVVGEEYSNTLELTNNMYAALIVSIWSEMEYFLKSLVRACYVAGDKRKKVHCNSIESIKMEIEKETGIHIDKCDCYTTVNAVRILNNSFKHNNGRYEPEPSKTYAQIEKSLLKKWEIKEDQKINYSKLPIQDIVLACNGFCTDLLKKMEAVLRNRIEITQRESIGHGG